MAKIHEFDALTGENKEKTISANELNTMLAGIKNTNIEEIMQQAVAAKEAKVAKLIALGLTEAEARA
jgi:hypothetical protein